MFVPPINRTSTSADVKNFSTTINVANWIYKKINNIIFITPEKQNSSVVIQGDLTVNGSIFSPSDERLKHNVSIMNHELIDDLMTLNPIIFSYKNDNTDKKHYGLLAQEIEKVFPELVEHKNYSIYDNEYNPQYVKQFKTVNYIEFIPIMLAKMKQMQNDIDELKKIK